MSTAAHILNYLNPIELCLSPKAWVFLVPALFLAYHSARERLFLRRRGGLPLPPGPPGLLMLGSILSINFSQPYLTFSEWKARYGDIVYCSLVGTPAVIINSERVARELIEKRSQIYSDRPRMSNDAYLGVASYTSQLPYGAEWKVHSRMLQKILKPEAVKTRHSSHIYQSHQLLASLYKDPKSWDEHLRQTTAASVIKLTYGYEIKAEADPFCQPMIEFIDLLRISMNPFRAVIFSAFPLLQKVPLWVPGTYWQRDAQQTRQLAYRNRDQPFDWVLNQIVRTTPPSSLVSELLHEEDSGIDDEGRLYAIKNAAGSMFTAGFETTYTTLLAFFLTMAIHPEVQIRAQSEMDVRLGKGVLPSFEDRDKLPYVDAILREIMRMYVMLPLALPHATTSDDIYEGYFIPKGKLMLREDPRWTNPEVFDPSRHLTTSGNLVSKVGTEISGSPAFGFGRRKCPGRFVAENTLWAAVASALAAFKIFPADEGRKRGGVEFREGVARVPISFPCVFEPREGYRSVLADL
ncbi:cytochrome P450 [Coniophora puteana RWD-64-598 SS2]|uniref:Cytochrome P450 n=1 Tax=Coniophora puteana (strain RWD-64-598) TaxID=741705 RepID=A0A5M3MPD0_CONPW|nr:cytochrome P450 [Coniophora puteana RWD-64-598 SS2]EIW80565.1 cytochrome P450 [Coniophora puteana RWD-64-598 SS2]